MYEYDYPDATYDLILSVSTIHHGYKEQIQSVLGKIYASLAKGGKIFITLPDFTSSTSWQTFRDHTELGPGTYAPKTGPEAGLVHSFYTESEIQNLFSNFRNTQLDLDDIGRWFVIASKR